MTRRRPQLRSCLPLALLGLGAFPVVADVSAPRPGLRLTLELDPDHALAGDQVLVRLRLANQGPGDYALELAGDGACALAMSGFDLHVTSADGTAVPGPQGGTVMSCVESESRLAPGASIEVRIPLQLRTGPVEPGGYWVKGSYQPGLHPGSADVGPSAIESPAVPLRVEPRSPDEMGAYIRGLAAELRALAAPGGDPRRPIERERNDLIRRLAQTGDPRIVPVVIDAIWAGQRFPPAARTAPRRGWRRCERGSRIPTRRSAR